MVLQLVEIPRMWGESLLDKLSYVRIIIREEANFIFWMNRICVDPRM
jgi:hypothetical protein